MATLDSGVERTVSLYGVAIRTRFPFANRLIESRGPARLEFRASTAPPSVPRWADEPTVFESVDHLDDGRPRVSVVQADGFQVVRVAGIADYYLTDQRIWCHLLDREYAHLIEIHLLGVIMSYWLEQRGVRVLHASAVALGGGAVGFIAGNKSGKSSIAAAFMARGQPLLTDDFLALDCEADPVIAYPGYPQMRMWPDQARHFLGSEEGLALVHPALSKRRVPVGGRDGLGDFHPEPTPLAALYLPERGDPGTEVATSVEAMSPRDAVIELVSRSFLGPMLEGIGLEAIRFESFVRLARSVPVRRLIYPHGSELLPEVLETVLRDVAGSPGAS